MKKVTVTRKRCSHCKKTKGAKEFNRCSISSTGLQSWCRDCQVEAERKRIRKPGNGAARRPPYSDTELQLVLDLCPTLKAAKVQYVLIDLVEGKVSISRARETVHRI
jgi:hypothetical protein